MKRHRSNTKGGAFFCLVVRITGGTKSNGHTRDTIPVIPAIPAFCIFITYTNNTTNTTIFTIQLDTIHTTNTSKKHIQTEKIPTHSMMYDVFLPQARIVKILVSLVLGKIMVFSPSLIPPIPEVPQKTG